MKEILKRLQNTGTIIGVASAVLAIVANLGFKVDNTAILAIVNSICGIGVMLGFLNNSTTKGVDNPFKEVEKEDKVDEIK